VDTKDLDGETNLKEKMVNADFLHFSEKEISEISGLIKCDMPNEYLDSWEGNVFSDNLKVNANSIIKNLLLKGSILKNTDYIIGLIIYCGFKTKIMKNAKNPRIKMSYVMKTMNFILKTVFLFQITCCGLFSIAYLIFTDKKEDALAAYILSSHEITVRIFVIKFFTFLVAYSHLIPISLYVAMEIVKIFQTWFIYYDNMIYDTEYQKPTYARTSDLIEELGQVEFLFSDKTGTLTVNKMKFKSCFIGGVMFGDFEGEDLNSNVNNKNENNSNKKFNRNKIDEDLNNDKSIDNNDYYNDKSGDGDEDAVGVDNDMDSIKIEKENNFKSLQNKKKFKKEKNNFKDNLDYQKFIEKENAHFAGDKRIANILYSEVNENEINNAFGVSEISENNNFNNNKNENFENALELYEKYDVLPDANLRVFEFRKKLINFFRVCTLCHSAINEKDKHGKYQFASASPDEIAFLQGAEKNGFAFSKRTTNSIEILNSYTKENEKWEILLEIPFDSDRQCMTMILKKKNDEMNTVHIMVKGADSKLIEMLQIDEINFQSMNSKNKFMFFFLIFLLLFLFFFFNP
jgi:magnesium-transporting ATPase (P-type)